MHSWRCRSSAPAGHASRWKTPSPARTSPVRECQQTLTAPRPQWRTVAAHQRPRPRLHRSRAYRRLHLHRHCRRRRPRHPQPHPYPPQSRPRSCRAPASPSSASPQRHRCSPSLDAPRASAATSCSASAASCAATYAGRPRRYVGRADPRGRRRRLPHHPAVACENGASRRSSINSKTPFVNLHAGSTPTRPKTRPPARAGLSATGLRGHPLRTAADRHGRMTMLQ